MIAWLVEARYLSMRPYAAILRENQGAIRTRKNLAPRKDNLEHSNMPRFFSLVYKQYTIPGPVSSLVTRDCSS